MKLLQPRRKGDALWFVVSATVPLSFVVAAYVLAVWRRVVVTLAVIVSFARVYVGAHLPPTWWEAPRSGDVRIRPPSGAGRSAEAIA